MVAVTFLCLTFTYVQLPTVLFRVDPHDLLGQDQQSWNERCSTGAECWAAEREKVQCQKKKKIPLCPGLFILCHAGLWGSLFVTLYFRKGRV